LHRRGTSKTYEHLEDLLREAGYKETRIFTPDSHSPVHPARDNDQDPDSSSKKQGVGAAVVGFLTGWVTGGNSSLTRTQHVQSDDAGLRTSSATPKPSDSSFHYHPSSITRVPGTPHHPSRAGNDLRHMVSTPSIPHACPQFQRNSCVYGEPPDKPSLPRNWLDNVARAIIFGVAATGVTTTSNYHQRTLRATRSSLSQMTLAHNHKPNPRRSGLSDKTNTFSAEPPALFTRLGKARAPCSQGLLKAQVLCCSAPASRASSAVRGSNAGGRRGASTRQLPKRYLKEDIEIEDKARGRQHPSKHNTSKPKNKKTDAGKPRVPSLARTRIEGDGWHTLRSRAPTPQIQIHPAPYFLPNSSKMSRFRPTSGLSSGYLATPRSSLFDSSSSAHDVSGDSSDDSDDDDDDDDSDDEGELTLARMLVPPKRQHSIQSLRKHLISSPSPPPPPPSSFHTTCSSFSSETTIRPSLSRRPLYHSSSSSSSSLSLSLSSSSTTTLRSSRLVTNSGTRTVANRVPSFSVAQSRLFNLVNSSCEKDASSSLHPPLTTTTTASAPATLTQRLTTTAAGGGGGGRGEWEHKQRKSNENKNIIIPISSPTPTPAPKTNSQATSKTNTNTKTNTNVKGKSKLSLGLGSPH